MRHTWVLCWLALAVAGCNKSSTTITTSTSVGASRTDNASEPATNSEPITGEAGYTFAAPVRLMADGQPISVEEPGYACPTVADVDQDGKLDLVVGQFNEGALQFFKNEGTENAPQLIAAGWLQTNDKRTIVPGVW